MRRFVWVALAALAACSDVSKVEPGPTHGFYRPTGIGVYAGKLVVASSNADLLYDSATGGSVITVDPGVDPATWIGGMNIESFAGQMVVADPADPRGPTYQCPALAGPLALVPARGADVLYRIALGATGTPSCGAGCMVSLAGGQFADAYAVGLECATQPAPLARAYVGFLRGASAQAWISQVDLQSGEVRSASFGIGQMLGFAYDPARRRLYAAQAPQGIRWVDLADGCVFGAAELAGGCRGGAAAIPAGLEARAIALSQPDSTNPTRPTRLYVLARVYDSQAAYAIGIRPGDVDGVLLVMQVVDDLWGQTRLQLVKPPIRVGYGPVALALLPARPGKWDVVAALTTDDPVLLLYDDDNDAQVVIARDAGDPYATPPIPGTGHPWVGSQPFGLAVDPVPTAAGDAHVYVGSFRESFVTEIDVPLADIEQTTLPTEAAPLRRISGGTP